MSAGSHVLAEPAHSHLLQSTCPTQLSTPYISPLHPRLALAIRISPSQALTYQASQIFSIICFHCFVVLGYSAVIALGYHLWRGTGFRHQVRTHGCSCLEQTCELHPWERKAIISQSYIQSPACWPVTSNIDITKERNGYETKGE